MFKKLKLFLEKNFTQLTLIILYLIGIGPTALMAKLFAKKFLNNQSNNKTTNWREKKVSQIKQLEKMY